MNEIGGEPDGGEKYDDDQPDPDTGEFKGPAGLFLLGLGARARLTLLSDFHPALARFLFLLEGLYILGLLQNLFPWIPRFCHIRREAKLNIPVIILEYF